MSWTNKQKALFVQACASIGWTDEQRHMLLSTIPHAVCGRSRVSSTSPRLNNSDFEHAMAVVESNAPGNRIVLKNRSWPALHFAKKADDDLARMRGLAGRLGDTLARKLTGGFNLAGWISKRVTGGSTGDIDHLNYNELYKLIEGLKAFARRNGVRVA